MLRLLSEFPQRGYPGDYLLARLNGRRALLISENHTDTDENLHKYTTEKAIRDKEKEERQWLFMQMNDRLRRSTAPLFFYFEINTLIQCLRFIEAGIADEIDSLLERSLMAEGLKNILRNKTTAAKTIECLERILADSQLVLEGLGKTYQEKGIQGCEEMIRIHFLQQAICCYADPDMQSFFRDVIYMQNTLTMSKCRRWKRETTPNLVLDAGAVKTGILRVSDNYLQRMASRLLRKKEIPGKELEPINLEPLLMTALLLKMNRNRKVGGEIVAYIEYILRIAVTAKNRRIRLHMKGQDKNGLTEKEMIH